MKMIRSRNRLRSWFLFLGMLIHSTTSDARKSMVKEPKSLKAQKQLWTMKEYSNTQPYISSPLSWPPFDSLPAPPSPSGPVVAVVFQPPVVYPPPGVPPPRSGTGGALWCVVKPDVPDPIIQEAVNYACGTGADCGPIQSNGLCFDPNTLIFHASFAFNSYWQRTKLAGGTCSFGGIAILVTMDPSHNGCHFDYF